MSSKFDTVDVHLSSTSAAVDAILQDPLLDGEKRYTMEVTEFTCPLSNEGPLPPDKAFELESNLLFRVRRKNITAVGVNTAATLLSTQAVIGALFIPAGGPSLDVFVPNAFRPMRTPGDLVYYLQRFFDEIKNIYRDAAGGIVGADHGGVPDVALVDADIFVNVTMTPNGTIRLYFGEHFCKHFFLESNDYGSKLLGFDKLVAFQLLGGVILTGAVALTGNADGTGPPVAGATGQTVVLQAKYPLTRHFDHRVRVELDTDLPVPRTVVWNTTNTQKISHVIATFPINMENSTTIRLNSEGANEGELSFTSNLFTGDIVWRRAESRVSERYEILNSKFFQNIRAAIYITRRVWDDTKKQFTFSRLELSLADGESWTAKLRFRTL